MNSLLDDLGAELARLGHPATLALTPSRLAEGQGAVLVSWPGTDLAAIPRPASALLRLRELAPGPGVTLDVIRRLLGLALGRDWESVCPAYRPALRNLEQREQFLLASGDTVLHAHGRALTVALDGLVRALREGARREALLDTIADAEARGLA